MRAPLAPNIPAPDSGDDKNTSRKKQMLKPLHFLVLTAATTVLGTTVSRLTPAEELWRDVEIIRTEHGVPHIRAKTLRAGAYGLAWVMSEDYGTRTVTNVLRASGNMARVYGRDSIDFDFAAWRTSRARWRTTIDSRSRRATSTKDSLPA
jgi:acyl-homoserine lactone acylase PvdQ